MAVSVSPTVLSRLYRVCLAGQEVPRQYTCEGQEHRPRWHRSSSAPWSRKQPWPRSCRRRRPPAPAFRAPRFVFRRHLEGSADIVLALAKASPTCWRVTFTRRIAIGSNGLPDRAATARASSADWLKRREKKRRQCSGTGTTTSASATSSAPARSIQRAIHGARSVRSPYFSACTMRGATPVRRPPPAPARKAADWRSHRRKGTLRPSRAGRACP